MNPFELLTKAKSIIEALRPFFFAIIGGLVVSGMNRCSEQKPVNLIVTNSNQHYENKLRAVEKRQDSLANAMLPTDDEAKSYLSKRYPNYDDKATDR